MQQQIKLLKNGNTNGAIKQVKSGFKKAIKQLNKDQEFIQKTNRGGEFMEEKDQKRVADIGDYYIFPPIELKTFGILLTI